MVNVQTDCFFDYNNEGFKQENRIFRISEFFGVGSRSKQMRLY